jgi:hypothetical protein
MSLSVLIAEALGSFRSALGDALPFKEIAAKLNPDTKTVKGWVKK